MSLVRWLGKTGFAAFLENHYLRLPFAGPAQDAAAVSLGSWEMLAQLLRAPNVDAMVVRDGSRVDAPLPQGRVAIEGLLAEGCTVLARDIQLHHPALAELAAGFERELGGKVDVHIYATPAGRFGFGWHYDAEEVFILQTVGTKEYSLRKNTVNPWPLEDALPADMHYEREIMPLMRCALAPGQWLYLPCGYWHKAEAQETSLSLAVGVSAPAAIDLLDRLRPALADSLLWRQRLPPTQGDNPARQEQLREHYQNLLAQLADDLRKQLLNEKLLQDLFKNSWASSGNGSPPP